MRASQPKSEDGHRQELELFDRSLWSVTQPRGLDRQPTRRARVEKHLRSAWSQDGRCVLGSRDVFDVVEVAESQELNKLVMDTI
jgi:hypothetical protein